MGRYYYKKSYKKNKKVETRKIFRLLGLGLFLFGVSIVFYVFFPLISWQIYFAPILNSQNVATPIPQDTIVSSTTIGSLIQEASNGFRGIDYDNAQNWFPNLKFQKFGTPNIQSYTISIPKLKLNNLSVSTIDYDLTKHLVNYEGTAIPAGKGNAVVFGHSTLPQLFDPTSYKTVFAYAYQIAPGDEIDADIANVTYKYKVESVTVVNPDNTTFLQQDYSDSFLTLVTCTPPGTTWKRLIIRARLQKI